MRQIGQGGLARRWMHEAAAELDVKININMVRKAVERY